MKFFNFTRHQWIIFLFSLLYVAGFTTYYIASANYEFLWYVGVMLIFFVLLVATLPASRFSPLILWGLSLWGLAHMAGGSIPVGDTVLYGVQLISVFTDGELTLVKYDQVVHAFGFAVATLVAHHLLAPRWKEDASKALGYALAAGVGMGLGALNEIVEFIAVLSFPETGVGGYFNTGLDLLANMIGVLLAVGFLAYRDRNK
ncbi:DUF2238 domain-containing protein [Candidatus Kaiserbacteria bacterium]|nr:MAG: DUF2238 domain-containing protein [Candidatus Kaiserbacteria bacterium]